jgi:hypothetical protein
MHVGRAPPERLPVCLVQRTAFLVRLDSTKTKRVLCSVKNVRATRTNLFPAHPHSHDASRVRMQCRTRNRLPVPSYSAPPVSVLPETTRLPPISIKHPAMLPVRTDTTALSVLRDPAQREPTTIASVQRRWVHASRVHQARRPRHPARRPALVVVPVTFKSNQAQPNARPVLQAHSRPVPARCNALPVRIRLPIPHRLRPPTHSASHRCAGPVSTATLLSPRTHRARSHALSATRVSQGFARAVRLEPSPIMSVLLCARRVDPDSIRRWTEALRAQAARHARWEPTRTVPSRSAVFRVRRCFQRQLLVQQRVQHVLPSQAAKTRRPRSVHWVLLSPSRSPCC